jgi:aerobic-type carbon monoxide dehydrogenase small subunit (CoxS/CutS family)
MVQLSTTVDGQCHDVVETRLLLVHYLRDRPGRTGTAIGCTHPTVARAQSSSTVTARRVAPSSLYRSTAAM